MTTAPATLGGFVDAGSVANGGTVTPDISKGSYFRVNATGAGLTIAAPILGVGAAGNVAIIAGAATQVEIGYELFLELKNTSGGATTVTWNAIFKQAATAPTNGNRRLYGFVWDGSNWVQTSDGVLVGN